MGVLNCDINIDVITNREFSVWYLEYVYKVLVTTAIAGACDQKLVLISWVRDTITSLRKGGVLPLPNSAQRS